ncbi:MAG: ABC transporter permease, partial [Dermatophilaceae bacterium]
MTAGRFARLWASRRVLDTLVRRDLRVRYARSAIGYLWTVIDPLAMALIYYVVFTVIFERGDVGHEPYFLFLLAGLLAWQWFNGAVNETARALLAEAKLVRSTNLPRELWVVRVVIAKGIEYLLSLPILIAFLVFYLATGQSRLDWQIVYFPLGVALQFVLCIGI